MANEEGFQVELFKLDTMILGPYLSILFNRVICFGFLKSWSRHVIHPIHKSSLTSDPINYRTIMIGHTFSKLYATTLINILSSELNMRNCRAKGQAGFKVDYQTMDHRFTLRAIIEEAYHHSKKLYYYFVDFHKAFDSIPRVALFQRLRNIGISEILLKAIIRLYEIVIGRLRTIEGLSNPI